MSKEPFHRGTDDRDEQGTGGWGAEHIATYKNMGES